MGRLVGAAAGGPGVSKRMGRRLGPVGECTPRAKRPDARTLPGQAHRERRAVAPWALPRALACEVLSERPAA